MFTQDRDLLTLEPNLFRDVAWVGQQLARGSARLDAGNAIFESGAINRDAAQPGMVLVVGRLPVEIIEVIDDTTAHVSLLRATADADPIDPADTPAAPSYCTTFAPQIASIHAQILAMLGLEPAGSTTPNTLTESAITNPKSLTLLESLGALHLIFAGASAITGPDSALWQKAEMYRNRFARERWKAQAQIDTNNDGIPDAVRRLNILQLTRA